MTDIHSNLKQPVMQPPTLATAEPGSIRWQFATRFGDRLRGLLGRPPPPPGYGLLIRPCRAIHTIGMRYAIDVVFFDQKGRIVRAIPHVRPARIAACSGAHAAGELAVGSIECFRLAPGQKTFDW